MFGEKVDPELKRRTGDFFKDSERYDDALEFYARTQAETQIREIMDAAREDCNIPVFLRAKVVLGEKNPVEVLESLAQKALEQGRPSMAALAYQKAGLDEKAAAIRGNVLDTVVDEDAAEQSQNGESE